MNYAADLNVDISEDEPFHKMIMRFIRIRQEAQFHESFFCRHEMEDLKASKISASSKMAFDKLLEYGTMDDEMATSSDDEQYDAVRNVKNFNDKFGGSCLMSKSLWKETCFDDPNTWKTAWQVISAELQEMKMNDAEKYCATNTKILMLHVEHGIKIDLSYLQVLLNSLRPDLVKKAFDQDLINLAHVSHLNCLYDSKFLFSCFDQTLFVHRSSEPFNIILSLCVLLYRGKCYQYRSRIAESVQTNLAQFIHRRKHTDNFKSVGMKHFMKCLLLNGIYMGSCGLIKKFLSTRDRRERARMERRNQENLQEIEQMDSSDDEDQFSTSDSDMFTDDENDESTDSDDTDDHRPNVFHPPQNRGILRPHQRNEAPPAAAKIVGTIIGMNESTDLAPYFPMSLKNLCRVAIKNSMIDYTRNNVEKLTILPSVLKAFMMFEDEIDRILKLVNPDINNN